MSNHPNMSYCMFHNTNSAMAQINSAIEDGVDDDEDEEEEEGDGKEGDTDSNFFNRLSSDEQRAFRRLVEQCRNFLEYVEQEGL